ncbi:hypothetical protein L7F22_005261 [Adiantum nelumboides]|nr:hypothetical protein [Adiantum nelumboides]
MATQGDDHRFKEVFRLPIFLLQQVSSFLYKHPCQRDIPEAFKSISGRVILVEKMVAITILRLASGARLIETGEHLGVHKSTVSKIVYKFVDGLLLYKNHFIHWPKNSIEITQVQEGFRTQRDLPNCCGAVDMTHVNMDKPVDDDANDWFDRNKNYSMCVQCVVDMDLRFLDVFSGWPGSNNDKRVITISAFYGRVVAGKYLSGPKFVDGNNSFREYIVGDGG